MAGELLERAGHLDALHQTVADATAGQGSVALVTGEAGIGKTSVIRAFLDALGQRVRVLVGTCDDLLASRPLGPLRDAVRGTRGPLERALAAEPGGDVFAAAVEELSSLPTVLVVEDVHWADDATLDVLRYLARRLGGLPAVLVLSFRDDALDAGPPLRQLLGALVRVPVRRLALPPLSPAAVAVLTTGTGRDAPTLHALTAGNPFYLTEALAVPPDTVPATVADAVLARLRRLSPPCRAAVEHLSVVPTRVGFDLAETLLGERLQALAEAEEHGILAVHGEGLAFRHELARRAVERSLPTLRRRVLNRAVVRALQAGRLRSWPAWSTTPWRPTTPRPSRDPRHQPPGRPPRRARTGRPWPCSRRRCDTATGSPTTSGPGSSRAMPGSSPPPTVSMTRSRPGARPSPATSTWTTRSPSGRRSATTSSNSAPNCTPTTAARMTSPGR